jgi:hypothetical protein
MKNQADRISSDFLAVGVSVRPYGCQSPQFSVLENLNSGVDDFWFPVARAMLHSINAEVFL